MTAAEMQKEVHHVFGMLQAGEHLFGISNDHLAEVVPILSLAAYPSTNRAVLGSISVRGVLIPVLDPLALCGLASGDRKPQVAALLRNEQNMVALAMDQVQELRRVASHKLQVVENTSEQDLVNVFFLTDKAQVNIFNVEALFAKTALPFANRRLKIKETQASRNVRPYLTFESGGVSYAIAVSDLFNTIPRRELESTNVASGAFLGKVTYHKRTIPVLDMNVLVDMSVPKSKELLEIVVLHVGENRLIGLAVDRICRIEYFQVSNINKVTDRLRAAMPLIKATHEQQNESAHTLIVDADQISKLPGLERVAEMSDEVATKTAPTFKSDREDIIRERNRNLVFSAGCEFAAPVQEIRDVLQSPQNVTPWGLDVPGLKGLFFFRNNMTPLVHLTQYLGLVSQGEVHDQHLLVCGTDDACVGFLVDGIRGILLSEWQTTSKQETGYHMVNVVDRGNTWLCPRLPLEALAIEVMRNLSRLEKDIA